MYCSVKLGKSHNKRTSDATQVMYYGSGILHFSGNSPDTHQWTLSVTLLINLYRKPQLTLNKLWFPLYFKISSLHIIFAIKDMMHMMDLFVV